MTYDIRKGEGLPEPFPQIKYPFEELEVGDTFFVPFEDEEDRRERIRISKRIQTAVAWANRKKAPRRFSSRVRDGGIYVGRVE